MWGARMKPTLTSMLSAAAAGNRECRKRHGEKGGKNAMLEDHSGMMVRSDGLIKPSLFKILSRVLPERRFWQRSHGIDDGKHRPFVWSFGNEHFVDTRGQKRRRGIVRDADMIYPGQVQTRAAGEAEKDIRAAPRIVQNHADFACVGKVQGRPGQGFGGLRRIDLDRLDGMTYFGEAVFEVRFAVASGEIDKTAGGSEACGDFPREGLGVWANQRRAIKTPLARGVSRPLAGQQQRQEAARLGQRPVRRGG